MSLLTVGTVAFDSIETPRGSVDMVIGGAAVYIAWAASYLVKPVQMVSIIGDDFPQSELAGLRAHGADTRGIRLLEGKKSFYWKGRYHDDMNSRDTLVTDLNVLAHFDPVVPDAYRDTEFLMLGNLTPGIQSSVIKQMNKRPRVVAMDTMNFWMDNAWDELMDTLEMVDILIINDEEARQLTSEYSLLKAARKVKALGPRYIVIKKGEHGALLFGDDQVFFAPGLPLAEIIDPTGAGDTFAGGFMGYLAATRELSFAAMRRAVIYGSVMASFCVEDFGNTRLKELTQEDIDLRFKQFRDLVHFE